MLTALCLFGYSLLGAQATAPNVLLVVLDDVGVYDLDLAGGVADPAFTPRLNQLAGEGLVFTRATAQPNCSPSRASLLTGLRPIHSGVESLAVQDFPLPFERITIPERLPAAFSSAAIGKWHLSSNQQGPDAARLHGFDHGAIAFKNIADYYDHETFVDGVAVTHSTYATTVQVDDALAWISVQDQPWFCYLAFSAAHEPFQEPPSALGGSPPGSGGFAEPEREVFKRMITAIDLELARLLEGIEPGVLANTTILVVGDNGTPSPMHPPEYPSNQVKNTVYEGGIAVPLIASGALVSASGSTCDALVEINDLFATVLELCGAQPGPGGDDSVSLVPYFTDPTRSSLRTASFAHRLKSPILDPVQRSSIREGDLKLHRSEGTLRLFDLASDPFEKNDLADDPGLSSERDRLVHLLDAILESPGLHARPGSISTAAGGSQELLLHREVHPGGSLTLILGSATEGAGATTIGRWTLPLIPDPYTWVTLVQPEPILAGGGVVPLPPDAWRRLTWCIEPGRLESAAGTRLRHIALTFGSSGNLLAIDGPADLVLRP